MTEEQKQLVRDVATGVMGWLAQTGAASGEEMFLVLGDGRDYKPDFGQEINERYYTPFNPLTRYDSAGLVIGAMEARGWLFAKGANCFNFLKYKKGYSAPVECYHAVYSHEEDWRQAMCEAALKAVRSEKR